MREISDLRKTVNMMLTPFQKKLIISLYVIALVLTPFYIYSLSQSKNTSFQRKDEDALPTPYEASKPSEQTVTDPSFSLEKEATIELLTKIKEKKALSFADDKAKMNILSNLPSGEVSGVVYQSQRVIIDYTKSADSFMVEILTTNIPQAKQEATEWFLSQGMSQNAICNYPVQFYIGAQVDKEKLGEKYVFNPLAEGC